jgi:hypothetical protein
VACFSDEVKGIFKTWKREKLCDELEGHYQQLLDRRVDFVEYGDPDKLAPKERNRLNCGLLAQALLHRAEHLLVSSGTALIDKNPYALALLVRGHVEATAVLGYFCHRVRSLARGNITFEQFSEALQNTVMGGKHDLFAKTGVPKSIVTMIENADKFIDTELPQTKTRMLQEGYAWLSEFAHPNFLSHSNAFVFDKATGRMIFRHEGELQEDDFQHLLFLSISGELFFAMYDAFKTQAEAALADEAPKGLAVASIHPPA